MTTHMSMHVAHIVSALWGHLTKLCHVQVRRYSLIFARFHQHSYVRRFLTSTTLQASWRLHSTITPEHILLHRWSYDPDPKCIRGLREDLTDWEKWASAIHGPCYNEWPCSKSRLLPQVGKTDKKSCSINRPGLESEHSQSYSTHMGWRLAAKIESHAAPLLPHSED